MAESELLQLNGVGPKSAKTLEDCGFNTIEKIAISTVEELSGLPGIGKATAEKIIASAKEIKPAKKLASKAEKEVTKETIPKPKAVKTVPKTVKKPTDPMPSAKKPAAKAPAKKPAAKAPAKKQSVYAKTQVSVTAQREIDSAPEMKAIKKKGGSKKGKAVKKEKISKTYGIVSSIVHDRPGKSANKAVIMRLYNTELPLPRYLGRKVNITFPNSSKQMVGTVSRLHGRKSSNNNTVIVTFKKSVSPHILTARATFA